MTKSKFFLICFILVFFFVLYFVWQNIFGNKITRFDKTALQRIAAAARLNRTFLINEIRLSLNLEDLNQKISTSNLEIQKEYIVTNSLYLNPDNNLKYQPIIKYKFIKLKYDPNVKAGEVPFGYYQLVKNLTVTTNRYISNYSTIKTLRKATDKANNLVTTSVFIASKSNYVYLGQKRFKIEFLNNTANFKIGSIFFSEFKEARTYFYLPFICNYKDVEYKGIFIGAKDFSGQKNLSQLNLRAKIYKNNKALCYLLIKSDNTIKVLNLKDKEVFYNKPRINNKLLKK